MKHETPSQFTRTSAVMIRSNGSASLGSLSIDASRIKILGHNTVVLDIPVSEVKRAKAHWTEIYLYTKQGLFRLNLDTETKTPERLAEDTQEWKRLLRQAGIKTASAWRPLIYLIAGILAVLVLNTILSFTES